MKSAVIYGTRPEAIKLAPVVRALRQHGISTTVINTGQHDSLMPEIMSLFSVTPDYNLKVMRPKQPLGRLLGRTVSELTHLLSAIRPDNVIVQGDTMTALAGALAGFYLGYPIAHVEAGLRTHQQDSPFPEEVNRQIIATMATWNFAPSHHAVRNLLAENIPGKVFLTGNTIVDALSTISKLVTGSLAQTKRVVVTVHRRENFSYLEGIFKALTRIAASGAEVIIPVHANPVVRQAARLWLANSSVQQIRPMDYLPWVGLLKSAHLIITDSGGLQEEAPVLGIPLLIVRQTTERPEVVDGGYGYLAGVQEDAIVTMALDALAGRMSFRQGSPYGDGTASHHIVKILIGLTAAEFSEGSQAMGGI